MPKIKIENMDGDKNQLTIPNKKPVNTMAGMTKILHFVGKLKNYLRIHNLNPELAKELSFISMNSNFSGN